MKKDLLQDCMRSVAAPTQGQSLDARSFQETFCLRCRNPECTNAGWSKDIFAKRVASQEDRLLNPTRVDPSIFGSKLPADFLDMLQTAIKLEIADQRGDWMPVAEFPILDGRVEKSSKETTDAVDQAVRKLQHKESGITMEEDEPFPEEPPVIEEQVPEKVPEKAPQQPYPQIQMQRNNTDNPSEGIILDGGPVAASKQAPATVDPWDATKKVQVVEPGTKIKMGAPK